MSADLILTNGSVRTQDPSRPLAEAVAVRGGRIMAVGSDAETLALRGKATRVIDCRGATVTPGFVESHIHYYDWALGLTRVVLTGTPSLAAMLASVREAAGRAAPGQWVRGQGWNESGWPEGRMPTRQDLDAAVPDNPAIFWRSDLHLAVCNTRALELAGIGAATPDPAQGLFGREADGRPNGILKDLAINEVTRAIGPATDEEALAAMDAAQEHLFGLGITQVHDFRLMGGTEGPQALRCWQRLRASGRLRLRAWMCLAGDFLDEAVTLGLRTGLGDAYFRIGHVKLFADGSLGARTAWMLDDYLDGGRGIPLLPVAEIAERIRRAEAAGLAVSVHAIGDRANRDLTAALEQLFAARGSAPLPAAPHRVEHCQMLRDEEVARFGRLARHGLVASVQPKQATDDIEIVRGGLGEASRYCYRFRDLADAGITLALGSDCPVADPSPLAGIHAAVARARPETGETLHPEQALTVEEAVRGYTLGPALACGLSAEHGMVRPGLRADLALLDRDIFACPAGEIAEATATLTLVGGAVVYERA